MENRQKLLMEKRERYKLKLQLDDVKQQFINDQSTISPSLSAPACYKTAGAGFRMSTISAFE